LALIILTLSLGIAIYAFEATGGTDIITGNTAAICALTISISDETGMEFGDDIDVEIVDIAAGVRYGFKLDFENYLLGSDVNALVIANTTYRVTLSYPSADRYTIYNRQDGTVIDRFAATESGYTADWVIRKTDEASGQTIVALRANSGNEEADAMFQAFYDAVKHIDGNEAWRGFYLTYDVYEKTHAERYVQFCSGTEEEWFAKSFFERFLWHETYLRTLGYIALGNYDWFFSSEKAFVDNTIGNAYRSLNTHGDGTEAEAYKTLMLWQYEYFLSHGTVFNFLTGMDYFESVYGAVPVNPIADGEDEVRQGHGDAPELMGGAALSDTNELVNSAGSGIWDKTISEIKGNLVTLGLLLVTLAALVGVIVYRRRRAIRQEVG